MQTMAKPEQVLQISPQNELRFRGKWHNMTVGRPLLPSKEPNQRTNISYVHTYIQPTVRTEQSISRYLNSHQRDCLLVVVVVDGQLLPGQVARAVRK